MKLAPGSPSAVLALLLAAAAFFAALIWVCLAIRDRGQARDVSLPARDSWRASMGPVSAPEDFLAATLLDFSWTEVGFVVKDFQDRERAKVIFRGAGALELRVDGETFLAELRASPAREIVLLRGAAPEGAPVCSRQGGRRVFESSRYEVPGAGALELRGGWGSFWRGSLPVLREGRPAGEFRVRGRIVTRGAALYLPGGVPLAIKVFLLAEESRRFFSRR